MEHVAFALHSSRLGTNGKFLLSEHNFPHAVFSTSALLRVALSLPGCACVCVIDTRARIQQKQIRAIRLAMDTIY